MGHHLPDRGQAAPPPCPRREAGGACSRRPLPLNPLSPRDCPGYSQVYGQESDFLSFGIAPGLWLFSGKGPFYIAQVCAADPRVSVFNVINTTERP